MLSSSERGDTLVEVMVSIAVMAVITVGTFAILNRGIGEAQKVSERTSVRALVSEKTELLNYFRDKYLAVFAIGGDTNAYPAKIWKNVKFRAANAVPLKNPSVCIPGSEAFYIDYNPAISEYEVNSFTGNFVSDSLPSRNNGLWIDPVESIGGVQPYIDLTVKACWKPIVGDIDENLSTALRLYDN